MHRGRRSYAAVIIAACIVFLVHRLKSTARSQDKVTVVLSAYETTGLRPQWLQQICTEYVSSQYSDLIDRVIVVWNEPAANPPTLPSQVKVLRGETNSMNNRWLLTPPHIKTRAVLVLDDDISVNKAGISCMLQTWKNDPQRLLGPFARRRDGDEYVLDELMSVPGSSYDFVLPRIMMLGVDHFTTYAQPSLRRLRRYVDEQDAHCDDLLLNLAVTSATGLPPLRIALPAGSIADYTAVCGPLDRSQTAGLADQTLRYSLRTDCLRTISRSPALSLSNISSKPEVAICHDGSVSRSDSVDLRRWRSMSDQSARELCPDLLLGSDVAAPRTGLGKELQQYCPETDQSVTEWIDALLHKPLCSGGSKRNLLQSARYQCSSWCIWDLKRPDRAGWHLTGSCFQPFVGSYASCDEWFYQRPRLNL